MIAQMLLRLKIVLIVKEVKITINILKKKKKVKSQSILNLLFESMLHNTDNTDGNEEPSSFNPKNGTDIYSAVCIPTQLYQRDKIALRNG